MFKPISAKAIYSWVAAFCISLQPLPGHSQTPPAASNKVLFFASRAGSTRPHIFMMNPDGSEPVNLSHLINADNPQAASLREIDPAWSPDGKQIAFTIMTDATHGEIYVMNADGTQRKQLTQLNTLAACPAWSPDGKRIAFGTMQMTAEHRPKTALYIMDADGSNVHKIGGGYIPAWSPDGKQILYSIVDKPGPPEMYIMNVDGTDVKPMVSGVAAMGVWSPDGQRIAYLAEGDDKAPHIFVMNADTSHRVQLTKGKGTIEFSPVWSADGQRIFFMKTLRESDPASIYVMDADGQHSTQLTPKGTKAYLRGGALFMMNGEQNESLNNLQQIGAALHEYAAKHEGALPPMLDNQELTKQLLPYLDSADVLNQPETQTPYVWNKIFSDQVIENFTKAADIIIVYQAAPDPDHLRNVLFLDGHVARIPEAEWTRAKIVSRIK
ncbi:MAG: PD40 domain-containing protein [Abitibacteriaceae bacterium]|nr:PD40 domain-containing protein [Abditibacteriaceae bacterium]